MIILSNHCGVVCRSKCARIYNDTEETSPYRLTGEKRERERERDSWEGGIKGEREREMREKDAFK